MDFEGLRWAGNIYQKFEAMCLEVEEVMYEDTVKYMENQVQKVGVSVKKFYSEVMQDLIPPSCVDPVKVGAGDLSLNLYAHTDVSKKLKPSMLENHKETDKKKTEDELLYSTTTENKSSSDVKPHSQLHPRDLVQNKCSELYSVKSKKVGVHKRPIGIKRISQNRCPEKMSRPVTSSSGDGASRLECDKRSGCAVGSDVMNATSSLDVSIRHDLAEALNGNTLNCTASDKNVPSEKDEPELTTLASDEIVSAESVGKVVDNSEQVSFLSAECVRQENDDSVCSSSGQSLPTESKGSSAKDDNCENKSVGEVIMRDEGTSMKYCPLFQPNSKVRSNTWNVGSTCDEHSMFCEDNFDMEVIENDEVAELGVENFESAEMANMDGSCVLVDGNKLHSVPLGTEKNKSYKKKIREALSSKLRSTKKQDSSVTQHMNVTESNAGEGIPDHPADSFESEWELL